MNIDANILNHILLQIKGVLGAGISNVSPFAIGILWRICVIDLILAAFMNIGNPDVIKNLCGKILKYGFFYYLVHNWAYLLSTIVSGFSQVGIKISGNAGAENLFSNPSGIAGIGVKYAIDLIFQPASALELLTLDWLLLCKIGIGFLIILCFAIVGLQLFCAYVEFYLVGTLNLVLIPFGANRFTAWIAQRASGSMLASGVKVMVCVFVAGVCRMITSSWVIPNRLTTDPITTLQTMIYLLIGSMALTFLAWQIPKIVASMFAGSPVFNGNAPMAVGANMAGQAALAYATGSISANKVTQSQSNIQKATNVPAK